MFGKILTIAIVAAVLFLFVRKYYGIFTGKRSACSCGEKNINPKSGCGCGYCCPPGKDKTMGAEPSV